MSRSDSKRGIYYNIIDVNRVDAPWIIMVHGFTHNSAYFSCQVSEFKKDYRIFLVDLRGHGKSTNISGPFGIEEYADDISLALDDASIEEAHYWGTHTGAAIGLVMAKRHPKRFSSLILEGTFLPGFPMPIVGKLIDQARTIAKTEGIEKALDIWFSDGDWFSNIQENPQVCRAKQHKSMIFEFTGNPWLSDLSPRKVTPVAQYLNEIKQPVLVYNGTYDVDDFKKAALHLKSGLSNVEYEEIADAGGFPAWENPKVVNSLVSEFLFRQICYRDRDAHR
jgi:pimeloyl-ACP methyl ester carboxylesterase